MCCAFQAVGRCLGCQGPESILRGHFALCCLGGGGGMAPEQTCFQWSGRWLRHNVTLKWVNSALRGVQQRAVDGPAWRVCALARGLRGAPAGLLNNAMEDPPQELRVGDEHSFLCQRMPGCTGEGRTGGQQQGGHAPVGSSGSSAQRFEQCTAWGTAESC